MRREQWGPRGADPVGEGRGGQGTPRLETGWSRRCPAAPQQPRLRPAPGARSRARCPCEERPRRFTAVTFSYASRAQVTIYISVSQQRRYYLPPAKERGERKAGGCFQCDVQPGQDLPLGRGGSTARITQNTRKRGDPETFHCLEQVSESRKDCNLPGRRDSGILLHVLGAYERQHVGPQPSEHARRLHVPLGSA